MLACSAAGAVADRPAVVATLHEPGGVVTTPPAVTIEALEANACTTYSGQVPQLYGPHGAVSAQPPGPNTWSLAEVLECGLVPGVAPGAVTELSVRKLNGATETGAASTLLGTELTSTKDFVDGALPLITYDGSNVIYYRPWRGGGDQNAGDKVEQPNPSPLAIDVFEGAPLTVVAQASSATVTAGVVVGFSATVSDASGGGSPSPSTLSYAWDFDGGAGETTSASATPSETFATAGTYNVTVQVTDIAGGGGADTATITVNPAANTPPSQTPPAKAPPTGPAQGGGPSPGGAPGKQTTSHGATTTKHPTAKVTHHTTTTPATVTPKAASHQAPPQTNPPTTPASPSAAATGTTAAPPAVHPTAEVSTPVKGPPKGAAAAPAGAGVIDGQLISDVAPLPVESSPLVSVVVASPATAPEVRRPARASILPVLAAALTIALLLGLGAGHQLGWRRRAVTALPGN